MLKNEILQKLIKKNKILMFKKQRMTKNTNFSHLKKCILLKFTQNKINRLCKLLPKIDKVFIYFCKDLCIQSKKV